MVSLVTGNPNDFERHDVMHEGVNPAVKQGASLKGRAVLHQALNKDLVGHQKFRLANERSCMAGFGDHLVNMVCPRKIMADGEA